MTEEEKRREAARRGKIQKEKRRRRLIWKRRIVIAGMMLVLALIIFVISAIRSCHQEAVETQARIRKEKEEKEEAFFESYKWGIISIYTSEAGSMSITVKHFGVTL